MKENDAMKQIMIDLPIEEFRKHFSFNYDMTKARLWVGVDDARHVFCNLTIFQKTGSDDIETVTQTSWTSVA